MPTGVTAMTRQRPCAASRPERRTARGAEPAVDSAAGTAATEAAARICERLATGHPALANVACEVAAGEVILSGIVPTYYVKQLAQTVVLNELANGCGVSRVQNRLQVIYR
jgi:hypothetical protein